MSKIVCLKEISLKEYPRGMIEVQEDTVNQTLRVFLVT